MKLSLLTLSAAMGVASAAKKNPFAPKVSANNAKAKMNAKLMRGAKTIRQLDGQQDDQEVDLTGHSLKFEKCQFIKQYDEEAEGGEENDTVLTTKRFVIFRLCPDSSCGSCNYNYGEYIVDMETYLEATLGYKQEVQEANCEICNECYENEANANNGDNNGDEDENAYQCNGIDTSTCYAECQNIENMEENGYIDASELVECQQLDYEANDGTVYYTGASCASSGTRIKIGMFADEECSIPLSSDYDIENYMKNDDGYTQKLSYHLLKQTFAEGECIANCLQEDEDQNNDNNNDGNNNNNYQQGETAEVCQELYEAAGKCEETHGFTAGINKNVYAENYANQVRNEELVCEFISTIGAGAYDQTGEIVVSGGRTTHSSGAKTTGGQKFALTFFILGSVGLAGYAAMLHQQLTKGAKADLSRQGGAMA